MAKAGKPGNHPNNPPKNKDLSLRSRLMSGRDTFRREEHLRIAPKHPGMGRR